MQGLVDLQQTPTEDSQVDIASKGDGGWLVSVELTEELGSRRVLRLLVVDMKNKKRWNGEHLGVRPVRF